MRSFVPIPLTQESVQCSQTQPLFAFIQLQVSYLLRARVHLLQDSTFSWWNASSGVPEATSNSCCQSNSPPAGCSVSFFLQPGYHRFRPRSPPKSTRPLILCTPTKPKPRNQPHTHTPRAHTNPLLHCRDEGEHEAPPTSSATPNTIPELRRKCGIFSPKTTINSQFHSRHSDTRMNASIHSYKPTEPKTTNRIASKGREN